MILECPSCRARYLVQIGLFAQGGRMVRCARCKNQWHFKLPTTIDVVSTGPSPAEIFASMRNDIDPTPQDAQQTAPNNPANGRTNTAPQPSTATASAPYVPVPNLPAVIKKWNVKKRLLDAVKVIVIFVVVTAWPVMGRDMIVRAVPGLRGVYELFGLHIKRTGEGLSFIEVKSELRYDGGTMRLYVDGVIRNTTDAAQLIPDIMAKALGADREVIQSWWVSSPKPTIVAGGEVPFHTEINASNQRTIVDVYLEFRTHEERTHAD